MADILVTGATGFIGRALCAELEKLGHGVTRLSTRDGDIADPRTLAPLPPADHVFHTAGVTFVPQSWREPSEFHRVNVLGTANVLGYCRQHGAKLTFISGYLYGQPDRLPISESTPPRPNNPYALSKHLAEQVCAFEAAYNAVAVTVIRPFNVFGPGQSSRFLVPHIVNQVAARRPVQVKDVAPKRDYVYLADLVDALVRTLGLPAGYEVLNIGSGVSVSVADVIAAAQAAAGVDLPVVCDGERRTNELDDVRADIGKAVRLLRWEPRYDLAQGLRQMLEAASDVREGESWHTVAQTRVE